MSVRSGRIVGQSVTPSTKLRVGNLPPLPRPTITIHDPAAVARLRAYCQAQAQDANVSAAPPDEEPTMPTERLTEAEVRQIHQTAVDGLPIADAVRQVVGDRIAVTSIYPYFKRYGLGSVKVARDRQAQTARVPSMPEAAATPKAVDTAVAVPPAKTAVARSEPVGLAAGLERLATIRDLVRELEAAGADVAVSFTFDLQVRYER